MIGRRYRPRRRLRSELLPLAAILVLPVALCFSFPSGVIGFVPSEHSRDESSYYALTVFDPELEAQLLTAARASWQSDSSVRRGGNLPLMDCGVRPDVLRIAPSRLPASVRAECPVPEYEIDLVPSGVAAAEAQVLEPEGRTPQKPAFSRADLLKLN